MTDDSEPMLDLGAWEAPPPPAGLADAVIARMREPRSAALRAPPSWRRWWIAAGAAAMAGGAAALIEWGTTRAPADGHGDVFAARATHLELAPSAVELDVGTEVRWQRAGHRLTVAQSRGSATWRVDDSDTLAIETAPASVVATGASLRVEVKMNATDAKVVGASAGIAALVTVIVYSGHVDVTGAGQTTVVLPGNTVEIRPGESPRDVLNVGAAPDRVRQLEDRIRELEASLGEGPGPAGGPPPDRQPPDPPPPPPPPPPSSACAEVECVLSNYAEPCCAQYRRPSLSDALDGASIRKGIQQAEGAVLACGPTFVGPVTATLKVAPDGRVTSVRLRPQRTAVDGCVRTALLAARFEATGLGGSFSHTFTFSGASCDSAALLRQGIEANASGNYRAALATLEQSYRCKPDSQTATRAFMAACNLRDRATAARYYHLHPAETKQALVVCVRNGIQESDLTAAAPACDYDALLQQGSQLYIAGNHAGALRELDAALQCKRTDDAILRAFMAACSLHDLSRAQSYYRMSKQAVTPALAVCIRNRILPDDLERPATCDASAEAGEKAFADRRYPEAVVQLRTALTCKRDPLLAKHAFLAACRAHDQVAAVDLAKRFADDVRASGAACVAEGIPEDKLGLAPRTIAPSKLRGLLTTGSWEIEPDLATRAAIAASGKGQVVGSFKLCLDAAGEPTDVKPLRSTGFRDFDQTIDRALRGWRFRPYVDGGTAVAVCTAVTVIHGRKPCDATDLTTKGIDEYTGGNFAAALALFELSLSCKRDPSTIMRAFMAACQLRNLQKAKYFYKLAPTQVTPALAVCIRSGILQDQLEAP